MRTSIFRPLRSVAVARLLPSAAQLLISSYRCSAAVDRRGIRRAHDDVDVAHGVATAPVAAGDQDFIDAIDLAKVGGERFGELRRLRAQPAALLRPLHFELARDLRGELRSESGHTRERTGLRDALEVGASAHLELREQRAHTLRPEPGNGHQLDEPRRHLAA